jgi:hypothetical protein
MILDVLVSRYNVFFQIFLGFPDDFFGDGGGNHLKAIVMAKEILDAIKVINEAGYVWRDAKPEVRGLVDFKLAKDADQ